MINDIIFRLLVTFILSQAILKLLRTEALNSEVNGLEIWPNLSSITITADTLENSRILICKGNEPIQWYFKKYDGTLLIIKNSPIKVFPSDKGRFSYLSLLSLSKATYLDTGNYTCKLSGESKYSKDIYVFIQHETHLLAIPEDFKLWYDISENDNIVTGQFRPTSPDVNVKITINTKSFNVSICNPKSQFKCTNGHCIRNSWVCNGIKNCNDGSDEARLMCEMRTCNPESQFKCTSGKCIHKAWVCDGTKDCNDGSDEGELCIARSKNNCDNENEFQCLKYQCIDNLQVCNGKNDCDDGSDEDESMCKERPCSSNRPFKCTNGQCLWDVQVCNGVKDCNNGSDEDKDMCQTRSCSPERQFKCDYGKCIWNNWVCNGIKNCNDGSDEDELMCKTRLCSLDRPFKCENGKCIKNNWICDGFNDCNDGSDENELMCKARPCSLDRPFKCGNGKCLKNNSICDGIKDCNDGSDEDKLMCKARFCNLEKSFKCSNGDSCIVDYKVCNGKNDCQDGSDEEKDMCKARPCSPEKPFKCNDGKCLHEFQICNGLKDCNNGSDEDELMCKVTRFIQVDQKMRFEMHVSVFFDFNIICTASRNNIIEDHLIPNPMESWLHVSDLSSSHVIIGQKLTLNCSLEPTVSFIYTLKWIIPDTLKNMTQNIQIGFYTNSSILLNIKNVSFEDKGDYICKAMAKNGQNYSKTYKLLAQKYNVNYLNLRIKDSINTKIRPAGYKSVQWTTQISAIQNTSLEWISPNGKLLKTKSEKSCMKSNNCLSEVIIANLQLSDSGVYRLSANNGDESKEIKTILLVEEKPTIIFIKSLNTSLSFYEIGKNCTFEFYISGYPLPDVEWNFKKCPNYPQCKKMYAETKGIKNETIQVSAIAVKLLITINITDIGILICKASNIYGNSTKKYTVLVTDISNGLEVKGPSNIVTGDDIIIKCGASKYSYLNDIKWIFPMDSKTQQNITITNTKTKFSYLSYLMIKNISNNFHGYFNCSVTRNAQSNNGPLETDIKSLTVKVQDPHIPVINNSSNTIRLIVADYGKPLNLSCFVIGIPYPTISWFQEDQPLLYHGNDSRKILNGNQILSIKFTEIENNRTYKCNATNRIGSTVLTYTLKLNDMNNRNHKDGIIFFYTMLTIQLGMFSIVGYILCSKRKKTKKSLALRFMQKSRNRAVKSRDILIKNEEEVNTFLNDKRLKFPMDKLKLGERLGSGAFGVVFKAKAVGIIDENITTTVAVKTVNSNSDLCSLKSLESELQILNFIGSHLNVVKLLGVCIDTIDKKLMMIVEYCHYGSISKYLLKHRNCFTDQFTPDRLIDNDFDSKFKNVNYDNFPEITTASKKDYDYTASSTQIGSNGYNMVINNVESKLCCNYHKDYTIIDIESLCTADLLSWSFQISRGMEYLASKNILHGDLAIRNIVLTDENIVKICDFGLARIMQSDEIYHKKSKKDLLPLKWMAIESIRDYIFSTKSDVWSFGIVLWELFSLAATPYPNLQIYELYDKLIDGYRMEKPKYANSQIYNIMLNCWETEPLKRPTFNDLAIRLGDILQDVTKSSYVDLNDHYMRINNKRLSSTEDESLFTTSIGSNYSIMPENYKES